MLSPFEDGLAVRFHVDDARDNRAAVEREAELFFDLVWQSAWDRATCGDFLRG